MSGVIGDGLVTVTVTFHPELEQLRAQLKTLPTASHKIIVDNASSHEARQDIRALVNDIPNLHVVENGVNVGLAAAVNQGVKRARELDPQARWCLLLDQDSEPQPGSLGCLIEGLRILEQKGERVGCVGPLLIDVKTGLSHGFHRFNRWRWWREFPAVGSREPISCGNLNGSGTLTSIDLFVGLGGVDESLFIDHVDTEWSFRVLAGGYTLWGIPEAIFKHRMGNNSLRYWFLRWRVWPSRSPMRHRYLFRNALWLIRRGYVPRVWKNWAVVKLVLTGIVHMIFDSQRFGQIKAMLQGVRDGCARQRHG
jgi:rhamnosyltransferase